MKKMIFDFMKVSEGHSIWLKDIIKKNNGSIRLFIHPSSYALPPDEIHTIAKKPKELLEKILTQSKIFKQCPIFIFEDKGEVSDLWRWMQDLSMTRKVYVIKTDYDNPIPTVGWEKVIEVLKELGVKTIVLSGMYLYIANKKQLYGLSEKDPCLNPTPATHDLRGCIYGASKKLLKDFNIKISHFVNPGSPKLYKEYFPKPT